MEERRTHERRIEDVEERLECHLVDAAKMNDNIEKILDVLEKFDTETLESIGNMIKGGRVMSNLTISISKVLIAIGIIIGMLMTFFKFIIK